MTIEPAYASFSESYLGSLEVGKQADFVVLSQDIMTVPEDRILFTDVQATAIDGEVVYGQVRAFCADSAHEVCFPSFIMLSTP